MRNSIELDKIEKLEYNKTYNATKYMGELSESGVWMPYPKHMELYLVRDTFDIVVYRVYSNNEVSDADDSELIVEQRNIDIEDIVDRIREESVRALSSTEDIRDILNYADKRCVARIVVDIDAEDYPEIDSSCEYSSIEEIYSEIEFDEDGKLEI